MRKIFQLLIIIFVILPLQAEVTTFEDLLLQREMKYEKEGAQYLQEYIVDKILGRDRGVVILDMELGIESRSAQRSAKESVAEQKKNLGEVEYVLPGVPKPRGVSETAPTGEAKEDSSKVEEKTVTTRLVIKKQTIRFVYDKKISKSKLEAVEKAIKDAVNFDEKRGDKWVSIETTFTRTFFERFIQPSVIVPLILMFLLMFFLLGPLASFLKNYIRTLRERGGTEVTVDSKLENLGGKGEGMPGAGGEGEALSLEEQQKKKKEEEEEEKKYKPFSYIDDTNLRRLTYLIRDKDPMLIALIMSYLNPEHMKEVLMGLRPELQTQVALSLADVRQVTEEDVREVDEDVKRKIGFLVGGLEKLLKILEEVDRTTRNNIIDYLRNELPELYDRVKKHVILFESFSGFPDQAMQLIIRELKTSSLAKALQGAPREIADKFFANMSVGAQAMLKEEMGLGRELVGEEIEEERKKIIDVVKRLENEGKIFVRDRSKPPVLENLDEILGSRAASNADEVKQYFDAGIALYEEGRYNEAIQYFQYSIELDPNTWQAHQYLGAIYYSLGRHSEAIESYEKVLQQTNDEALRTWLEEVKSSLVK